MMNVRSILIAFFTLSIILTISASLIAYGRGYRVNVKAPTRLSPTGIISATSDPVGSQVLVDGQLKTATNNSFSLAPGWYTVSIQKEGYISWEKNIRVQGEVVARADAYLFPTSPSLSPITTSGVLSPAVSPDGSRIAFIALPNGGVKTPGLYTLELSDRPLGGRNRDPKLISALPSEALAKVGDGGASGGDAPSILWSPDGTEIVVLNDKSAAVYDISSPTFTPRILDGRRLTSLQNDWESQGETRDRQKLMALPQGFVDVATSSAKLLAFSPDESKLLYEATASATIPPIISPPLIGANPTEESRSLAPGNLYMYDSREDKNYLLLAKKELPAGDPVWFPTNKHLLLAGNGKIDVMEYDRTNWTTLYAGPFEETLVTPWPGGGRIVILTNLNPGASTLPNLYTINLR